MNIVYTSATHRRKSSAVVEHGHAAEGASRLKIVTARAAITWADFGSHLSSIPVSLHNAANGVANVKL
jgi:hypothetical protein